MSNFISLLELTSSASLAHEESYAMIALYGVPNTIALVIFLNAVHDIIPNKVYKTTQFHC